MGDSRLDAWLAHRGWGTRSEVRDLIRSGRVAIGGKPCRDAGGRVGGQAVTVDGQQVVDGPDAATLLLHKPLGVACSNDPAEAPLVGDLYPAELAHLGLQTAGRLDRDTSGLLVVTSDGALIHRLTSPKAHVAKRYRIRYTGRLSARAVERCAHGMVLEDDPRPTLPARLEIHDPDAEGAGCATLHLHEGRYHQVRRMIAALGGTVIALHRDRIGRLELPTDLAPGTCRNATGDDLARLVAEPDDGVVPHR